MHIVALARYGPLAASSRQRFLQYRPALAAAGITLELSPLLDDDHMRRLVRGQRASPLAVARSYARRGLELLTARPADLLWLHCESFPYLPGWLELAVFRRRIPVVYDVDDAIFHIYDSSRSGLVRRVLGKKLEPLLRRVDACTCGNAYLADHVRQFCERTLVVPTVVDTDRYLPASTPAEECTTIGWIGSPSTWSQVRPLLPMLADICARHAIRFRAVGPGAAAEADLFPGMDLVEWREDHEIADVQAMNIGIMPLIDGPFVRGKSGYKLVQYMACGLPVVASPIGVNRTIVEDGVNGFLAGDEAQWRTSLERLITDVYLRRSMGKAGRVKAVAQYSLSSQAPRLIEIFRSLER